MYIYSYTYTGGILVVNEGMSTIYIYIYDIVMTRNSKLLLYSLCFRRYFWSSKKVVLLLDIVQENSKWYHLLIMNELHQPNALILPLALYIDRFL